MKINKDKILLSKKNKIWIRICNRSASILLHHKFFTLSNQ